MRNFEIGTFLAYLSSQCIKITKCHIRLHKVRSNTSVDLSDSTMKYLAIFASLFSIVNSQLPCEVEKSYANATLTCYPPKSDNGYQDGTLCISECDYNLVEHNCNNGTWDTDINLHGCNCEAIGSTRGGEWICSPNVNSISSEIKEGTKYEK